MATVSPKTITSAQLTTSAATYYLTPANTKAIIKKLTFTNSTATAQTVTVYLVPSGGTSGVTNILVSGRTVAPGETYECFEAQGQTFQAAGFLQAKSDAATAITINGAIAEIA